MSSFGLYYFRAPGLTASGTMSDPAFSPGIGFIPAAIASGGTQEVIDVSTGLPHAAITVDPATDAIRTAPHTIFGGVSIPVVSDTSGNIILGAGGAPLGWVTSGRVFRFGTTILLAERGMGLPPLVSSVELFRTPAGTNPSASAPDIEFVISRFSELPNFTFDSAGGFIVSVNAFLGSASDVAVGEDSAPCAGCGFHITPKLADIQLVKRVNSDDANTPKGPKIDTGAPPHLDLRGNELRFHQPDAHQPHR